MPGKSRALQAAEADPAFQDRALESAYSPTFCPRATEYCLLGATNEELAAFFNVRPDTIQTWLIEKPSFRKAVDHGREAADGRVARALYRRATGMSVKKERVVVVRGELKTLYLTEELPPDTNAAALWLSNRQRSKWRAANSGSEAGAGFDLAGFVGALTSGIAKRLQQKPAQPGDDAAPLDPLDVALDQPSKSGKGP